MSIPSVPNSELVDKEGNVTKEWRIYFDQLTITLQNSFPSTGFKMPQKSNDELSFLKNEDLTGGFSYNYQQRNMQANTDGSYKPLNTYEELTTDQINDIPSGQRNGRFVYDTDADVLKVGFNNDFLTVTTT